MMKDSRHEGGFALIGVLALLLILALLASGILLYSETALQTAVRAEEQARAEYLVKGAFETLLHELEDDQDLTGEHLVEMEGETVELSIRSEDGLININRADEVLLSALFASQGASPELADQLAARTIDWRDDDNLRTPGGAEAVDYSAAGMKVTPRNSWFETSGELTLVKGMPEDLMQKILPLVTVYSNSSQPLLYEMSDGVAGVYHWAKENSWKGQEWLDVSSRGSEEPPRSRRVRSRLNSLRVEGAIAGEQILVVWIVRGDLSSNGQYTVLMQS